MYINRITSCCFIFSVTVITAYTMLWATIVLNLLILVCVICNAQESDNCTEEDCYRGDKCIGQYIDLEIYVLNNKTLTEKLAQTFFNTGKAASKFVKITYHFQTSSNIQDNIINCSSQQSTYIWSEAALYLLGPKAMYWFTLFAVNIYEIDVTIELPCLCNDVYNSLLSRLTYLVRKYVRFSNMYVHTYVHTVCTVCTCTHICA